MNIQNITLKCHSKALEARLKEVLGPVLHSLTDEPIYIHETDDGYIVALPEMNFYKEREILEAVMFVLEKAS